MASGNEQKSPSSPASGQPSADGMAAAHQDHGKTPKLHPIAPGFDLTCLRCRSESRLHDLLWKDDDLVQRFKCLTEGSAEDERRAHARLEKLTESYRVDPAITPNLFQLGELLTKILRTPLPMDIFVCPCHELNAECTPSRKGKRLVMYLNSALVTSMNQQELLFAMGHEAGHVMLGHLATPGLSYKDLYFSPMEVMRVRALGRSQEISADRIGLLACQDVRAASSALFKIASGLTEKWVTFDEAAYARHFDDLSSLAEVLSVDDWADMTHPFPSLRVKALIAFGRSGAYAEAFGKGGATVTADEVETGVSQMLSVFDPGYLPELEGAKEEQAANAFITNGALMLIAADGVVEPEKVAWLKSYTKQEWSREELAQRMSDPRFHEHMAEEMEGSAFILREKLPEVKREVLLRTVIDAALSGGALPDAEMAALVRMRDLLNIPQEIAHEVFQDEKENVAAQMAGDAAHVSAATDNASHPVAGERRKSTAQGESPQPAPEQRSRIHRSGVTLADLVSKGRVALSDTLFATYKGKSYVATLKKDDADPDVVVVVYDHKPYDSVNAAAVAVTGKPVVGWEFWKVRSRDGKEKGSLKELRDQ